MGRVRGRCSALPYTSVDSFFAQNCSCLLPRQRFRCYHSVGLTIMQVFLFLFLCHGPFDMILLLLWVLSSWIWLRSEFEAKSFFPGSWDLWRGPGYFVPSFVHGDDWSFSSFRVLVLRVMFQHIHQGLISLHYNQCYKLTTSSVSYSSRFEYSFW